jgi:hypothetical protein
MSLHISIFADRIPMPWCGWTLSVMRGKYSRRDLIEAVAWAEGNLALLHAEWSRLNER